MKRIASNQKLQRFVLVLGVNLSVKNALKLSGKYLEDDICKIKQKENIPVTLRTFLNQLETQKNLTLQRAPLKLPYLKFSAKFLAERKRQSNNIAFEKLTFLYKFMARSEVMTPK